MSASVHDEIPHFFEIMKIIEGSLKADHSKVIAYTEQFAQKLEADGHKKAAERVRRALLQSKLPAVKAASATTITKVPVDTESRLALADERTYDDSEVEVVMSSEAGNTISEFVQFVRSADTLTQHGVGVSPTLLLYGPPGCGKTEIGKLLSAKLQLPLITARLDSLVSSYLGSTAKNIRHLFDHAMSRPCVLFLDELDAIAKLRDDRHELGELKRVVVSLLQNIDALNNQTILVGATNHEHLLDPAVWRRFAFKVKVELPNTEQRYRLFHMFLDEFGSESDCKLAAIISDKMSGADIRQCAEDTKRSALIAGEPRAQTNELLRRIALRREPDAFHDAVPLGEKLAKLRELNSEVFSYRRLAAIFDVSLGYVHKLLKQNEANDAR